MVSRSRPDDCCVLVASPPALSADMRDRVVAVHRALGDPTRLDVFRLIAAQPAPICVCDIVDRFDVSQPTISHHLKTLRDAGLVVASRRGVWAYYAVAPGGPALLRDALGMLLPESPVSVV